MNKSFIKVYIPCDSAALSVGADEVCAALIREAQIRGAQIEIVRNGTRGMLWLEPLVEVETKKGRVAYGPVAPDDVASLFESDFLKGGKHKLGQGVTEDIPYFARQQRLTFNRCGVIDPLSLDDYQSNGGLEGMRIALSKTAESIVEIITESGLRGRGGAGFPTGIKWETARKQKNEQKYICCNADEGDSGTFADRMLMEGDPFSLLEGMVVAGLATGAENGIIYIRSEYPAAIKVMKSAIKKFENENYLGSNIMGSGKKFLIDIKVGAGAYICGEESSMLESIEGKRGQVKVKPPIPAISGLFGKPTIVNNVLSLATVPTIMIMGASAYKDYGLGRSRGTQPFQLAGDIAQGGLIELAFGVSLDVLVNDFGGGTHSGKPIRTVQVGGPLGAYIPVSDFDVEMGYEELALRGGMLGHGGVVVFNDSVDMANQARFAMEFCEIESCGKCTPCRVGATRGKETIDKIIAGENREENFQLLDDLCELMTDASLCAMGGLTPMPVKSALKHFPEDFGG